VVSRMSPQTKRVEILQPRRERLATYGHIWKAVILVDLMILNCSVLLGMSNWRLMRTQRELKVDAMLGLRAINWILIGSE
jgi:hypothetical protein